jgi:hypothetical protein
MRKTALLLLTLLAATAAFADHYADTYVIPIAGHTNGVGGTMWMSDVAIRNFSNSPMTVQFIFIESGNNYADNIGPLISDAVPDGSVTVPVNGSVMLTDILAGYEKENIAGALIVGSDRPFAVTSRAYSNRSPLGQTVPATRDFFSNSTGTIDNTTAVYIPGIMHNARTRTNVGFAAGSGGSVSAQMVVEVTIRNADGASVGTRSFFIPPGNFAHYQFNIGSIVQDGSIDVGTAEFRITEGEGTVVPYASLIDNATGEAAYIMGQFPNSTPPSATAFRPFNLFRQLLEKQVR